MQAITLSRRQVKNADRVGGIELMILWPAELGPEPNIEPDREAEAEPREKAYTEQLVRASCETHGLVPVHARVACVRRPEQVPSIPRGGEYAVHLAVTIIGRRWVHASTQSRGRTMWAL